MAKRNNENTVKTDLYKISPLDIVVVEGFNSRVNFDIEELKNSIKENGVLNPISVIPFSDDESGLEKYRLVDGERRYRAVMQAIEEGADIQRVPALFVSKSCTQEDLLIQQIARNDGKPFNEYEAGLAIKKIMDVGGYANAREVIRKLGWQDWKSVYVAHLNRDERVQKLLRDGNIEGVTVRRIYQANKGNEIAAVKEILKGAEMLGKEVEIKKTDKEGNVTIKKKVVEKITLDTIKRLDDKSKTIVKRDTEKILAGFRIFKKYREPYNRYGIKITIDDIIDELGKDKTITQFFEERLNNAKVAE